jgi:indole-3-glycerol phosphate synthase
MNFLEEIVRCKKAEIKLHKKQRPAKDLRTADNRKGRDFASAISKPGLNIIAEVKKASPSKGVIREDFNYLQIADIYEKGGASAISILTEEIHFKGSLRFLTEISKQVKIPVLRKDFIIDPYQIYESKYFGADAILLIAALLEKEVLRDFLDIAGELGLSCLVEVHDRKELEYALKCKPKIIGINNRNLKTFKVDIKTTLDLIPLIPSKQSIIVSESGIHNTKDAVCLKNAGVNAVLIGESLMLADDICRKLKEFLI